MHIWRNLRLVIRLFFDRRVPAPLKALPVAALVYLLLPVDLLPDALVRLAGLGWLDDFLVLLLASILFIGLCPRNLVDEHLRAMGYPVPPGKSPRSRRGDGASRDTVEGSYRFIDSEK